MVKINRFNQLISEGFDTHSREQLVKKIKKLNSEYEKKCKELEEAEKEIKGLKEKVSNLAESLKLRMSSRR